LRHVAQAQDRAQRDAENDDDYSIGAAQRELDKVHRQSPWPRNSCIGAAGPVSFFAILHAPISDVDIGFRKDGARFYTNY
jgi:hypothetical protein